MSASERMARQEQDDIDHQHGQQLLDLMAARGRQGSEEDPLVELLRKAHQAKASEGEADQQ